MAFAPDCQRAGAFEAGLLTLIVLRGDFHDEFVPSGLPFEAQGQIQRHGRARRSAGHDAAVGKIERRRRGLQLTVSSGGKSTAELAVCMISLPLCAPNSF